MTESVSNHRSTAFSQWSLNLAQHWLMKSGYDVQTHKHESIRHCCKFARHPSVICAMFKIRTLLLATSEDRPVQLIPLFAGAMLSQDLHISQGAYNKHRSCTCARLLAVIRVWIQTLSSTLKQQLLKLFWNLQLLRVLPSQFVLIIRHPNFFTPLKG